MSRALELCFQLKQYDVLYQIADNLTESTSPVMIARVSSLLHYEMTVHHSLVGFTFYTLFTLNNNSTHFDD